MNFTDLPDDCLVEVFGNFHRHQLHLARCVCKRFRALAVKAKPSVVALAYAFNSSKTEPLEFVGDGWKTIADPSLFNWKSCRFHCFTRSATHIFSIHGYDLCSRPIGKGTWTKLAEMPSVPSTNDATLCVHGDVLYIKSYNVFLLYYIQKQMFHAIEPVPDSGSFVLYNGKPLVTRGRQLLHLILKDDEYESYDVWTVLGECPGIMVATGTFAECAMAMVGDTLYISGHSRELVSCHVPTMKWKYLAKMASGRSLHQMFEFEGRLYVLGMEHDDKVESYDIQRNEWRKEAKLPRGYDLTRCIVV
eukprot:TRINITY_DN3703_c0_g1_i1.p1 TRINITY_DN3703_c0_g1~~TRINITY_DN3703_c0_g1_i1.p1  ORF type:complete len:304 (-),score=36.67 TRINITY_DN3703_c0_g1_i1:98-1009(-)